MSQNYSEDKEKLKKYTRDMKDVVKLDEVIRGLRKECQELTSDLVGTRERESQYKTMFEEAQEEKEKVEDELNELLVQHSGLQAKFDEVDLSYKNKIAQFEEQGKDLEKLEKDHQRMNEINEKLKAKQSHIDKELEDKYKLVIMQRESMNRMKDKMIKLENDYDSLNSKHNTDREVLQTEIYTLKHEIAVLTDKVDIFKKTREHWVKKMEKEMEENEELQDQITHMKLKLSDAFADKRNVEGEYSKADKMRLKTERILTEKEEEIEALFKQKENLHLKLSTKTNMYQHYEKKTAEYIARIRDENKKLKRQIEQEKDRAMMMSEDIRTK